MSVKIVERAKVLQWTGNNFEKIKEFIGKDIKEEENDAISFDINGHIKQFVNLGNYIAKKQDGSFYVIDKCLVKKNSNVKFFRSKEKFKAVLWTGNNFDEIQDFINKYAKNKQEYEIEQFGKKLKFTWKEIDEKYGLKSYWSDILSPNQYYIVCYDKSNFIKKLDISLLEEDYEEEYSEEEFLQGETSNVS